MKSAVTISLVPEASGGPFVFWGDFERNVQIAAELGFDAVEIFPPDADAIGAIDAKGVVAAQGLSVAAVGTGAGWVKHRLSLADPSEVNRNKAIDFIKRIMDAAASVQAPAIIGSMQGRSSPEVPPEKAKAYLRSALEVLDRHADACGQRLLYEPLNRYETDQCNTLEMGVRMVDGLPNTFLLADWFHMNIEEADMAKATIQAGHKIGHIHFADSNRRAVGMGHTEIGSLIKALQFIGYDGYLSAEVFPKPDSLEAAKQTMVAFRSQRTS